MAENLNKYTEFKDIKIGQKFIDSEGFEYTKTNYTEARHESVHYREGFMDYVFASDNRLRVQS